LYYVTIESELKYFRNSSLIYSVSTVEVMWHLTWYDKMIYGEVEKI